MDDHDLLIRVDENVKNLTLEIKALKDDTVGRLSDVEASKLDRNDFEDFKRSLADQMAKELATLNAEDDRIEKAIGTLKEDHEIRMRSVERFVYIAIGVITVIDVIGVPILLKFILK